MSRHTYRNGPLCNPPGTNGGMFLAALIAQEYRRDPSTEQLMERFGMCRAMAYRWRHAWQEAAAMIQAREGRSHAHMR